MVYIVEHGGEIKRFYTLTEVADYIGIFRWKLSGFEKRECFVVNGYFVRREPDTSFSGRWARMQEIMIGAN